MATKQELEVEIKTLKDEIRELKKSVKLDANDFDEEIWGVVTFLPDEKSDKKRHKVVHLKYSDETKQGIVLQEESNKFGDVLKRDFPDIFTALGYATKFNNEHIIKRAQGRK